MMHDFAAIPDLSETAGISCGVLIIGRNKDSPGFVTRYGCKITAFRRRANGSLNTAPFLFKQRTKTGFAADAAVLVDVGKVMLRAFEHEAVGDSRNCSTTLFEFSSVVVESPSLGVFLKFSGKCLVEK